MTRSFIVAGARTPIGKFRGGLAPLRAVDLGGAAIRAALTVLEPLAATSPLMPRIEHVQMLHPDDRRRFAAAGIAASVQPVHLGSDAMTAWENLRPRRPRHHNQPTP